MRTIKEEIEFDKLFEGMVLESVFERHMSMVIDQFKKYASEPSKAIREFFKKLGFAVDKVDASRVTVIDYIDKDAEKEINNALDDKDKVIFGLMRNPSNSEIHVAAAYVPKYNGQRHEDPWVYLPTKPGHIYGHWDCIRENPLKNYEESANKNRIKTFKHCCEVWIVDMGGSLNIADLQRQRKNAQYGVWQNTPEYYAKVAQKNLERYKQMAARIKMERGSDFDMMMKQVDEMVKKMCDILTDMHNNMKEGGWGLNSNLSYKASEFHSYVTYMLQRVQEVLRRQKDYEEAKVSLAKYRREHPETKDMDDDSIFSTGYYLKSYREAINDVNDYREKALQYYNELLEGIKAFKERTK